MTFRATSGHWRQTCWKSLFIDEKGNHRLGGSNGRRVWTTVEERQFGHGGGRRLQSQHHLAPARRDPKYLHAALNDQKNAGAWLSFPEQHFLRSEPPLDSPLREYLELVAGEARKQGNLTQ